MTGSGLRCFFMKLFDWFGRKKKSAAPVSVDERLQHIAFIMDGNGRWATKRGLPREYGHRQGSKVFEEITQYCCDIGISHVTVYAFSTENWSRPASEVNTIMSLFATYISKAFDTMMEKDFRIVFLGDKAVFDADTRALMERLERESAGNAKHLNIAINYGGRDEILHAVNSLIEKGRTAITAEALEGELYTAQSPAPDLIVRTGGELRLSNFLLWQAAYAELYFTDILWPDLTTDDVDEMVRSFYQRKRRYGGV